jgi:hypothetical protein
MLGYYGMGTEDGDVMAPAFSFGYGSGGATVAGTALAGLGVAHTMGESKLLGAGLGMLLGLIGVGGYNYYVNGQVLPLSEGAALLGAAAGGTAGCGCG